jgi:polysaccharide deacetylase 2 family uncharacterized protein YibQ
MVTRRRRSRRRRGLSARLRRYLIEHRFNAAQALLGVFALTGGVWLLWPQPDSGAVDHRGLWERSLQSADADFEGRDDAFREGLVPVTESSLAMSAKRHVPSWSEPEEIARPRLAQVARGMPAIGVPEESPASAAPVTAKLPHPGPVARDLAKPELSAKPVAFRELPGYAISATAASGAQLGAAASVASATSAEFDVAQLVPRKPPVPESDVVSGTPTWLRNAVATPFDDGLPLIAMVIDDLGLRRANTAALIEMPGPLTLAFLPYANGLEQQTRAARAAGHELLLHVPMEATGHEWPGPNALMGTLTPQELLSRLRSQLRSFRGFVGVNNHMGSLLTADRPEMALVMAELRSHDLLFLDSRTTAKSVAADEAQRQGVPHAERDVFLDNELGLDYVRHQLSQTEQIARRRGFAVAIGHPHDVTIEALRGWLPTLKKRGFALVPVSTVVARESCAKGLLVSASACGRYVSAHNTVE